MMHRRLCMRDLNPSSELLWTTLLQFEKVLRVHGENFLEVDPGDTFPRSTVIVLPQGLAKSSQEQYIY